MVASPRPTAEMSSAAGTDRPSSSTLSVVFGTAILALTLGYFIGQGSSIGLFSSSKPSGKHKTKDPKKSWPNSYDVTVHPDSSEEEVFKKIRGADIGMSSEESLRDSSSELDEGEKMGQKQGELNQFEGNREECKLVLVVRMDLGMGKGTIIVETNKTPCMYYNVNFHCRQDRSTMLTRNSGLLPCPIQHLSSFPQPCSETMGTHGSSKSRRTSEE